MVPEMRISRREELKRLPRPKPWSGTLFVPPAGTPENIAQLVGPAGSAPGIAQHIDPLMKRNADRIVGPDVLGQAKPHGVGGILRFKGAEKPVPDDQRPS